MNGRPPLVLLAEDDPLSLKLMRDVLQANGFQTVEVMNGTEAVEHAARILPDVVVMDVGLPGLDGVEATRMIKATRTVPVVAVTAYAMPADEQRMRGAGCDAFLTKPLRFAEFVEVVRNLSGSPAVSRQESSASGSEK
jgi:two-component system cell cycle response regulator DivK